MEHQLGTTLTKTNGPTLGRLNKAYVSLSLMPERSDRTKTTTLDRYGSYEVRLIEFSQGGPMNDSLFWLELYCHVTQSSLDSCLCDSLDDAETVADHLISCAKQLHDETE
jgi:hypothetical protein